MPEINDEVLADKNEVAVESRTAKDRANEPAKIVPTKLEFPNLT